MENDDLQRQLDEWKKKYYQSISELEQQKNYDELLQRSLGRLALAAQGLDNHLDKQLKSLRTVLRGKNEQHEIEHILEQMEKAIASMESNTVKQSIQSTGDILADLLKTLKLPKAFKTEAKRLSKQLATTPNKEIGSLIPEVLTLLDNCLSLSPPKKRPSGLGFHLFGIGKKPHTDEVEHVQHDQVSPSALIETQAAELSNPPHNVLIELLERLSLPVELRQQATQIRSDIEQGITDEQLPEVINAIADIVSTLGSQVINAKQQYGEFLISLTSRLSELDQHIRQTSDDDAKAFEERTAIGQSVEKDVLNLRVHIDDASNLEQLKSSVSQRLDHLNQHFENYRKSDHQRFEQSQQQIQQLNIRIKEMEEQSNALRESANESRELAMKDALTGIWNRHALNEYLEREYVRWQRYQKPLSIVVWDVDFFKRVNDDYGHTAGDKVLKTIAQIFQQETRNSDFIARFGGEEFVGIFPETRLEDALSLANKIREKVEHSKFHYENKPVPITASAGLAMFRPNDTIDDVFKRADKALYRAKEAGRNRCLAED